MDVDILTSTGPWTVPLAVTAIGLLGAVVRALAVTRSDEPLPPAGPPHHAVVAWGVLAGVVGLLGTVVGLARLAQDVQARAGGEAVELAAVLEILRGGAVVAASPLAVGLALFALSVGAWLILGFLLNRRGYASSS